VAPGEARFATADGQPFVPFGVNYFRPGTGWAPQIWKQFDPEATRQDFERMRAVGVNCVRVFLTYGSFLTEPGVVSEEGLRKLDRFLELAEAHGIYVHPTGPDHWEGLPSWARGDRMADDQVLVALETFWRTVASRYRGRSVLFAYDLLNEPEVGWDSAVMQAKWNRWLGGRYADRAALAAAWGRAPEGDWGAIAAPPRDDAPGDRALLDYQRFREELAEDWTRRQVAAIRAADPEALVTVGLIQWSVPVVLAGPRQYSAFRPERLAPWLDFLEVHFYPLARGAYHYDGPEAEAINLAYLESVVAEVARPGKPVVLAEFGWYGGGQPRHVGGAARPATEEQQAAWCRAVVETTAGLAAGWLHWGFYDQPEARDVTELIGLARPDGTLKAWGRIFQELSARRVDFIRPRQLGPRPALDWDACVTGGMARQAYLRAWAVARERR
jgi:endo-1,4-beta-mannosidase